MVHVVDVNCGSLENGFQSSKTPKFVVSLFCSVGCSRGCVRRSGKIPPAVVVVLLRRVVAL